MNHNLAMPWTDGCSPPFKSELVFYSAQCEDLVFPSTDSITLTCQAGRRSVGLRWTLARNMRRWARAGGAPMALGGDSLWPS